MSRIKKKSSENGDLPSKEKDKTSVIDGEAKRGILAIFLLAFSVVSLMGFFNLAGKLGLLIDKGSGLFFGWGKWMLPVILVSGAIVLLFRKETLFYISKILGLVIIFLSCLGFFHIYFKPETFWEIAKKGEGGGFIGSAVSYVLIKIAGVYAASVILVSFLIIGLILAFNFSVVSFFEKMLSLKIKRWKEEKSDTESLEVQQTDKEKEFIKEEKIEQELTETEEARQNSRGLKDFFQVKSLSVNLAERKEKVAKLRKWQPFPLELLEASSGKAHGGDVNRNAKIIIDTLRHFGIEVELGEIKIGPTVTQYSFRPGEGIKLSKITALHNDLALALASHPIRIEAPIPGKSLVGIEVRNKATASVRLRTLLQSKAFKARTSNLTLALGEDVSGEYIFSDLQKMPHLLIAGSTGTGKSVCVNAIILTLLYQNPPENLRFIMIDPKRVELSLYNGIPHLLSDTIVENGKALNAFKWAIGEMERRYRLFQETSSRDLESYNQKALAGFKRKYIDAETGETTEEELEKLPYIVIIIDELAELMASHGKEVEGAIIRLAQMARAVGMHLIVSTQRPSVEVLTGLIKANIGARIAFKVATQIDSRTILDSAGAEKLLGDGDMLFLSAQSAKLKRIQGVLISEDEVKRVVEFIKNQDYQTEKEDLSNSNLLGTEEKLDFSTISVANPSYEDSLYEDAKRVVIESGKASSSLLQRRLRIGYARAARLIDMLEEQGIIGPGEGAKPREVLVGSDELELVKEGFSQLTKKKPILEEEKVQKNFRSSTITSEKSERGAQIERKERQAEIQMEERDKWQI